MRPHKVCQKSNGASLTNNGFPFKVISSSLMPFSHHSLSRFYVLLEGFFIDVSQLCRYGPFDAASHGFP